MNEHKILMELDEIHFRYERLTSLIGILQIFIERVVEVTDAPADSLSNALYEIELGMDENNERLKAVLTRKGGEK